MLSAVRFGGCRVEYYDGYG